MKEATMGMDMLKLHCLNWMLEKFSEERKQFDEFMNNEQAIEQHLQEGEEKARAIAHDVLGRVKNTIGF